MSQLNLKQILSGDNLSTVVDKLNYNFDQIILNGGGPMGLRGIIGAPGIPGLQGRQGGSGPTGPKGSYIFVATGATPSLGYAFEEVPISGDIFLEAETSYIGVWGYTAGNWNLVQTVQSPSSNWLTVSDYASTGAQYTAIANDYNVTGKGFFGSPDAFGATTDSGQLTRGNYIFDAGFTNTLSQDFNLTADQVGQPLNDTVLTLAARKHQFRIIASGLDYDSSGSYRPTPTSATPQTNRGGIFHSLERDTNANVQVYKIQHGDTNGEKYFSMGFNTNSNPLIASQIILGADTKNRVGIGVSEADVLGNGTDNSLIASLSINNSLAIGDSTFYAGFSSDGNGMGLATQGNLAVGTNNCGQATGTFVDANGNTLLLIDTPISSGSINSSSLILSSDFTNSGNTNQWNFIHDAYNNVSNSLFGSLKLSGIYSLLGQSDVMFFGLTGDAGISVAPTVGVFNTNPISLFEIGAGVDRVSIGETTLGADHGTDTGNYIGFNLHRSPVFDNWTRRGNGTTDNGGTVLWSNMSSGLNVSFFASDDTEDATGITDGDVKSNTRFSINRGSIIASDITDTSSLGNIQIPVYLSFGAAGTTGSGNTSASWRRSVAMFGDSLQTGIPGSPTIFTTHGVTQSQSALNYFGVSVLPQYAFWGPNGADSYGLYLANSTTVNPVTWTPSNYSTGIAVGGTSGISVNGDISGNIRIGLSQRDPLERVQIGNYLTIHDGGYKHLGYNMYYGFGTGSTGMNRIYGSTASPEGFGRIVFKPSSGTASGTFTPQGVSIGLESGSLGSTAIAAEASINNNVSIPGVGATCNIFVTSSLIPVSGTLITVIVYSSLGNFNLCNNVITYSGGTTFLQALASTITTVSSHSFLASATDANNIIISASPSDGSTYNLSNIVIFVPAYSPIANGVLDGGVTAYSYSSTTYSGLHLSPPLQGPNNTFINYSNVPQLLVGMGLSTDSSTSSKRGTISLPAQFRSKNGVYEDIYNIGLYSYDTTPVLGIAALGSNNAPKAIDFKFIDSTGNVNTDLSSIYIETDYTFNKKYQRTIKFGNDFRVGINSTPAQMNTLLTANYNSGLYYSSTGFDIASLVVQGVNDYFSSNNIHVSTINKGSIVIDQTMFGNSTWASSGSGNNEGLFFKNGSIIGASSGRTVQALSNSYAGDWAIQYAKLPSFGGGFDSGLNFWKPTSSVAGNLFLSDTGSVGVGTTNFNYSTANAGTYETAILAHGFFQVPSISGGNQDNANTPGNVSGNGGWYTVDLGFNCGYDDYIVEFTVGYPGVNYAGDLEGMEHGASWPFNGNNNNFTMIANSGITPQFYNTTATSFEIALGDNTWGKSQNIMLYWKAVKNFDISTPYNTRSLGDHSHYYPSKGSTSAGSAKFAVSGSILCTSLITTSDKRFKENIHELDSEITKIRKLSPSSFNMIDTPNAKSIGFIAQEVIEIYPEIVRIFDDPEYEDGKMTLDYLSFIPILTKGIQEQQLMLDEKDLQIKNLESRLSKIEKILENRI